jgi:hypothetical protein
MRAAQAQSLLAAIRRLPKRDVDAVFARTAEGTLSTIEGTLALGWVPMAVHMDLSDALRDTLGPERSLELWRTTMTTSFERPLLRGFVRMTTNLLGVTPMSLFRRGESIYEHVTRDVGKMRFEPTGPTSGVAELQGFPASRFNFACYVEGTQGCLLACFDICRAIGTATVTRLDDVRGEAVFALEWTERSA